MSCVIKGPNDFQVYLNGQRLNGSYDGTGLSTMVNVAGAKAFIGYIGNNLGPHYYEGSLDEIRIWNYARTVDQIRSDMCKRLNGNETGLVGYWKMDLGSGIKLIDDGNGNEGVFEGGIDWVISGAPIGDESFFSYFSPGAKKVSQFKNEVDSFWISSKENKWEGYHIYKVNQSPNTINGSSIVLDDGYYGVFPIFTQGDQGQFRIDLGDANCSKGDFRLSNDDTSWEPIVNVSDTSLNFSSNTIVEFAFIGNGNLEEISQNFQICPGESVLIEAFDDCVISYAWNDASVNDELEVSIPGSYWVDRTTNSSTIRSYFDVQYENLEEISQNFQICPGGSVLIEAFDDCVISYAWNDGSVNDELEVSIPGSYWVDRTTNTNTVRSYFDVQLQNIVSDVISENVITVCPSDLPLELKLTNVNVISWSNGQTGSTLSVTEGGSYTVEFQTICGIFTDEVTIKIEQQDVTIPNVFTPNGDGINDCFVISPSLLGSNLIVVNRAGAAVFESENYQNNWCMPSIEAGTYFYLIKDNCLGKQLKGWLSVLK